MKHKKIILISLCLVILITLIIILSTKNKKTYNNLTCTKEEEIVNGKENTTYIVKYDNDKVKKVEYIKKYYGKTNKEKENINTLCALVQEEAKMYKEKNGFDYKLNRKTSNECKITYYFDMTNIDKELLDIFNIKSKYQDMKDYFDSKDEYTCK